MDGAYNGFIYMDDPWGFIETALLNGITVLAVIQA